MLRRELLVFVAPFVGFLGRMLFGVLSASYLGFCILHPMLLPSFFSHFITAFIFFPRDRVSLCRSSRSVTNQAPSLSLPVLELKVKGVYHHTHPARAISCFDKHMSSCGFFFFCLFDFIFLILAYLKMPVL